MTEKTAIKCLFLFSLLGVLNGLIIDRLIAYQVNHFVPYLFTSAWLILFSLAYDERHTTRLVLTSLIATVLICFPMLMLSFSQPNQINAGSIIMLISLPFYAYVIHAFHHAFHVEGRLTRVYTALYNGVWHTYIVIIVATIFAGIANSIVQISAWGFKALGYDFLSPILHKISYPYYSFILYFGLGITKQFQKLTNQFRLLILKMAYYLYPVIMVFTMIFFILYIIKNPILMTGGVKIYGNETLLILVILGILIFNAYFRDGLSQQAPFFLGYLSKIYRIILFLCALLVINQALRDIDFNIDLYLYLLLMFLFTGTYAISTFFSLNKATAFIQRSNVSTALFYIAAIMIIHNPVHPLSQDKALLKPFIFGPGPVLDPLKQKPINITLRLKEIDDNLGKLGLNWIPSTSMIANIANAGFCPGVQEGICRVQYQNGHQIGRWLQGQCVITYDGKQLNFSNAQVLTGDLARTQWQPSIFLARQQLPLGVEYIDPKQNNNLRILYACRAMTEKAVIVGKKVGFNCNIAIKGKEIIIPNLFQELGKKP